MLQTCIKEQGYENNYRDWAWHVVKNQGDLLKEPFLKCLKMYLGDATTTTE